MGGVRSRFGSQQNVSWDPGRRHRLPSGAVLTRAKGGSAQGAVVSRTAGGSPALLRRRSEVAAGFADRFQGPGARNRLSLALTGRSYAALTAKKQAAIRQLLSEIRSGTIMPDLVMVVPGRKGVTALPVGVDAAFVPGAPGAGGTILLSRSLTPQQRKAALREEFGEAIGARAAALGVPVRSGDVGARMSKATDGIALTTRDFKARASDTVTVRLHGRSVQARARVVEESIATDEAPYAVDVKFFTSNEVELHYVPEGSDTPLVVARKAAQPVAANGQEVPVVVPQVNGDLLTGPLDGEFKLWIVDDSHADGGYYVSTTAATLNDADASSTRKISYDPETGVIQIRFDEFGDGQVSGENVYEPSGYNAVGDGSYNDAIIEIRTKPLAQTARPPESEDDPGEADTSPDTDETPGSEGAPDATDDDAAVPGPAPGSNVDPSKPGLQVASPEEENPAPPVDETGEEIPQEDLPRRDVYVEISFDTGDAVAVEVWQDGEWVEVASKPQFVPGARNMKGRAIVKLEQVGDTPPRVRVRNRSQDNAIISDRDRSRTIRTEEDGIVKVQFEDNFTVNEDGTAGGDDYQDVVVRHADNPDDLLETATSLGGSINAVELSEGYENLYTTREVYAEVGLFSNDELIVEVRDPETGAWTEVARKEEGAVLLGNGRTAVKVNQAGTQPPEIRVRNVTAEGEGEPTVIYSSHDKRVQTRTIGDATVFGFEDRWGTSEDDRFNDVMVSFTDTPPEGVEVVDGPITPPTGDASNSETDSENDHYITFNVDVLEPDRDYLVTTTDPETGKEVVVFDSTDSNFDLSAVKVPASTDDRFPSLELKTSTDGGETWNEREEWAESIDFTGDQTNNADGAMRRVTFNDAEQQPYPEPVKKTPLIQISMEVTFVDPDAPIYELPAVNGPPAKITIKFPEPAALGYQDADFRVLANPRSFLTGGSEDSEVVDYDSTDPDASSGTFILPKTLDGTDVDLQIQMKVDGEWRTMNFRTAVSKDGTTTTYTYYEIEDSLYENPILSVSVDQPNGAKSDDKSPGPNINTENDAENGITRTSKNLPLVSKENATTEDILVTFERGDAKLLEVWDPVLGEWRELHRSEAESGDQVTVINDDGDGDTNGRYRAIVSVNWIKTEQDYSNPELKPRFRMTNLTTGEVTDSVVDRKKMRTDVRDGYRIGFEANYDGTNTDLPVGAQGVDGPQTQSGDGQDYNDVTVLFSPSIDQTPVDVGMNDVTVGEDLRLLRRDAKVNDIRDLLGPGDNFDRSDAVQFKIDGLSGKILVNGEELGDFDDRDADGDDATDFLNLTVAAKTWNRDLQDSGLGAADGALMKMFLSQNEGIDFSTAGNTGGYFSFPPRASRRGGYLTVLAGVNSDILGQIFEVAIGGLLGSIFGPSKSYPSKKMPDSMLLVAVWEGLDLKGDKEVPLAGSDGGTVNIPDYHSLSEGWKEARNRDAVKKVTNYSTGLDGAETKKKTISHSDTGFDDDEEYYEFSWQEPNGENVEFGELGAIWWTLATGNVSAGERDQLIRSFRGSLEYFNENFADKLGVKKVNTTTADDFSPNGLDMTGDDARYVLRMLNGGVEIAGDVAENPGDYPGVVLNNDGKTWSFDPSALTPVQRVAIVVGILRIKSLTSEQKSAILERLGISQDDIDALAEKFPTIEGDLDTNLLMGAYRFDGADFISVGTGGKLLSLNTELVAEARAVKPLLGFDDEMLTALGLGPRFQQVSDVSAYGSK